MEKGNETREKGLVNNSGSGQKKISYLRGRPLPSHQGTPNGRNRIDVIATLRVAAPWQKLRNPSKNIKNEIYTKNKKIEFRKTDIRIKRYQDLKYRLIIFSVDASGSLAVGRLAEAKGAVELLLAKAYSSRDQVALISFRGEAAETLLTPSKSLTKTKRALSSLPGGGGTPLAAGLKATLKMALDYRHKGFSPVAIILTDGKANIDLEGGKGREKATEDSTQMAKLFSANEVKSILIDTSNRMQESAEQLANHLGGQYLALPRANAKQLSNAVMRKLN
jgi:magnesium chelatase subunit D